MEFLAEPDVAGGALRIYTEDGCATLAGQVPLVAEFAELAGAAGGIVAGIENEDDGVAAQGGKGDGLAGVVGQREIGRGGADGR